MNLRFIKRVLFVFLLLPSIALANEVDLALEVTSPQEEQTIGTIVPFHFQITNNSDTTATNVVFENDFSNYRPNIYGGIHNFPNFTLKNYESNAGTCDLNETILKCSIERIKAHDAINISIDMRIEYVGVLTMKTNVSASEEDINTTDNLEHININVSTNNADTFADVLSYPEYFTEYQPGNSSNRYGSISPDGNIITFPSSAKLISEASSSMSNIYVYDRKASSLKLSNVSLPCFTANKSCNTHSFSADGNIVSFLSKADNIVNNDNNKQKDLFIHNNKTNEIFRASISNTGIESNKDTSFYDLSANGRYAAFISSADNLVNNDYNDDSDIFIYDIQARNISKIEPQYLNTSTKPLLTPKAYPNPYIAISSTGRYIVFSAGTLKTYDYTLWVYDLYLWDKNTNTARKITQERLPNGDLKVYAERIDISDNERYVVYNARSSNSKMQILRYDIQTGETIAIVSGQNNEEQNGSSSNPSVSEDGKFITFSSSSSNLVENDNNNASDIFIYDSDTKKIKIVSLGVGGIQAKNHSQNPKISADGKAITYHSMAHNLALDTINSDTDMNHIYVSSNPFLQEQSKQIDISIDKTASTSSIEIDSNITYTLTIDNISADTEATATEVSATDTLPAGLTFVSATPSTGSCTEDSGTVTCNLGDIAVGDPSITIDIVATASEVGKIINTATVSATETDLDISNNSSEVSVTVIELTDAYIDGSIDDTAAYYIGDKLTYSFEVGNNSSNPATDVTAEITLPTNLSISSVDTDTGTCSTAGQKVTCIVGDISSANANITVEATPSSAGNFDVEASVTTTKTDSNEDNNSDTVSVTVNPKSDIAVSLSDSSDPIYAGNNLTYTITVTNNGPSDASNIKVEDTLPTGVNFVSASAGCNESAGVVTCNIANLAIGSSSKVDVVIKPTTPGTITNKASVSADEFDDTEANNSASEDTIVNAVADLSITQTDEPDPVYSGSNVTYTLKVTNNGINTASNIKITDTLPAGVTFVSASSGCSESVGVVTCNVTNLAKDASTSVNVVVKTGVPGTITNKATVSATEYDPNTDNNSSEQSTEVKAVTDMEIVSASASPNPVYAGDGLTYTVKIKNNATQGNTAQEIKLTFTFNDNIVLVAASSCAATGNTVTCDIGPMTYNQEKDIQLVIQPNMDGELNADITVSSSTHDPDESNNNVLIATTIEPAVDLVINMTEDLDPVLVKQDLTYTITVTNTGPSLAENVILTDTLPGAATVQSFTTSKGTCVNNIASLDCDLGNLADDESVTIDLVLQPTNGAVGALVNTATVSNDTYERPADPDNNTASVTTTVNQSSTVKVSLKGKGSGSVTGTGISCPGDCEETFNRGDTITLTAAPDAGSTFDRWQGGVCKGKSPTCTFTLDKPNMNVQASFK